MVWKIDAPYKAESKKIVWEAAPFLRGRGLDIGAGDFKVLPHAISVDNMNHAQFGFSVRPDVLAEASKLDMFASSSMDFVYSSHTLEHVENMEVTLKEWWRLVKQNGYLILYLPHKDLYPRMGQPGANSDHKRDIDNEDVIKAMPNGWDLIENQVRDQDDEYSFFQVFRKAGGNKNVYSCNASKSEKTACVVRYGAFGDNLMASSVFAGLKDQGFHVTVFAAPPGSDVIQHDPHIDKLVLFDKDQIPNGNLGDFWRWHQKKYDRWVNLSESVEGTLLALPDRTAYQWNPYLRHKMLNINYVEFQHDIAQIPHKPQVRFYPTDEEKRWARSFRDHIGGPVLMWSLAGSGNHKTWAGLDQILAMVLITYPAVKIVLVGAPECQILEAGWEKESRIYRRSGKWTIRQSLAFLSQCDVVVGPETGVLNAASGMPMRKVVLLSHSSEENLTRDWVNTVSVHSEKTACRHRPDGVPACHMMHYGWDNCTRDAASGTARCQVDIDPADVWDGIASELTAIQRKAA